MRKAQEGFLKGLGCEKEREKREEACGREPSSQRFYVLVIGEISLVFFILSLFIHSCVSEEGCKRSTS